MRNATLSTKGRITIPAEIGQALQVATGESIELVEVIGAPVAGEVLEPALVDGDGAALSAKPRQINAIKTIAACAI